MMHSKILFEGPHQTPMSAFKEDLPARPGTRPAQPATSPTWHFGRSWCGFYVLHAVRVMASPVRLRGTSRPPRPHLIFVHTSVPIVLLRPLSHPNQAVSGRSGRPLRSPGLQASPHELLFFIEHGTVQVHLGAPQRPPQASG